MTTTATPHEARRAPGAISGTAVALRRAVVAEWSRVWSVRTAWLLLLATALLMGLVTSTFIFEAVAETPEAIPVTSVGQLAIAMGKYGLLVLAMLAVTAEFSTGAIRTSLQWTPRRGVLLAARTAVTLTVVTVMGLLLVVACDLALWSVVRHEAAVPPLTAGELAASAGWVAVAIAGSTLLTVGLSFALRHTAGTLTAVFLLLFVLPAALVESAVPAWLRQVGLALPGSGVISLLGIGDLVSDGRAVAVIAIWSSTAMVLGTWAFFQRDV